jgi:hypothetical protein
MTGSLRNHLAYSRVVASVAIAGGLVLVSPAGALAGTLDQSQTNTAGELNFGGTGNPPQRAQTFTAGITGQLDQVDVYVVRNCAAITFGITVEIRALQAGVPADTVLASANVPAASIATTGVTAIPVTFSNPATVTLGTQYAIVLAAPGAPDCDFSQGPYQWAVALDNVYLAGSALERESGSNWQGAGNYDHAFKTYVLTEPPPGEPPPGDPPPPGGTPTSSEFTRTLSIAYSQKKDKFKGRIASESPACISGQKVRVFEKEKGKDPKLGSDASLANGRYSLKEKNADGKFYATVEQTSVAGGTCLAAKSEKIEVKD